MTVMAPSPSVSVLAPVMSSDEINLLVYAYLAESTLDHTAFALYNESRLADFVNDDGANPALPPSGHLIRLLQKGLLYLQAEAKYRGEDAASNPPRLIGYNIPDTLPLPRLPKSLPPPPESPTSSEYHQQQRNGERERSGTAANSRKKPNNASHSGLGSNGSKDRDLANAVAGPSKTKRKESGNTKDSAEEGSGQLGSYLPHIAKKQKTAGGPSDSRSPTSPSNDGATVDALSTIPGLQDAGDLLNKHKKGKARAIDDQGDSESLDAGSSGQIPSTAAPPSASTAKGPLARAVAAAASATSKVLPSALTGNKGTTNENGSLSDKDEHMLPPDLQRRTSSPSNSVLPTARRSISPNVARNSVGSATTTHSSATSTSATGKGRPRSTSPNTSLRNLSNIGPPSRLSSSKGPSPNALTPTLDASGMSATNNDSREMQYQQSGKGEDVPKQTPWNIIKEEQIVRLKGHTMPVQPCHWNPKVPALLATGSASICRKMHVYCLLIVKYGAPDPAIPP